MRITFGGSSSPARILLVHASTRSIDKYMLEDHPEQDVKGMLHKNNASDDRKNVTLMLPI